MSETDLIEALLLKKPYFGSALRALQGDPARHKYMEAAVRYMKEKAPEAPVRILEIGSWAGASAVTWAKSLEENGVDEGEVLCIDPWESFIDVSKNADRHYLEMERSLETGSIFQLFLHNINTCGVSERVKYIKGRSGEKMPTLEKGFFSIIYIDGAHHYKGVLEDLEKAQNLLENGGIICGDDLELQMHQLDQNNLSDDVQNGLDYTKERAKEIYYHPGVTKAVGELFGEVAEWEGFWAIQNVNGTWTKPELPPTRQDIPDHLVPFVKHAEQDTAISLDSYNVFKFQNKLIAISKNIGSIDPSERIGNCDIFPLILSAATMDDLNKKVEEAEHSLLGSHLELVEQTERYNYIKMGKRMFAVSTSLGPVDLKAPIGSLDFPPYVIQGETPDAVRQKVRTVIAEYK